ncbi:bifunctional indole-3-glycerol-phosphate synthase TrpC/phosphoribosylanthranilate isomerase TrpF [Buchnera aphidicola]|uniref:bifunctional indole-3-glycerol-phosphate synthase TrpC/phosphoribosylanthranilate isomerase TrpF n=1 Tax=Buchnera aphidicola TaxID=9 RepID=UPI0031B8832F
MKINFLNKILKVKKDWINFYKKNKNIESFKNKIKLSTRNFYNSFNKKKISFILECKKKSPSLGLLRKNFNLFDISNIYKKYASVISVVTEEKYFGGNFKNLSIVSNLVKQPILCKDFIIDEYQIYLARYYQADAILLMLSILHDNEYIYLSNIAKKLNMGVLTEINNIDEMKRAIKLKSKIIGINNRNLNNLSIDLNITKKIAPLIPKKNIIISESGIDSFKKIRKLKKIVNGFLIGSYIMKKKNIKNTIKSLIFGNNKICGLTRKKDAIISEKSGAIYGGLIFCNNSVRKININLAKKIINSSNLKYVAVFNNNSIQEIIDICNKINLQAIQLHGNETQKFINNLIKKINPKIKIWKTFIINNKFPKMNFNFIKHYLFDNNKNNNKKTFNWSILKNKNIENVFLAGGLNEKNCKKVMKFNCFGLDFNSGLEKKHRIKDKKKIKNIFNILRNY